MLYRIGIFLLVLAALGLLWPLRKPQKRTGGESSDMRIFRATIISVAPPLYSPYAREGCRKGAKWHRRGLRMRGNLLILIALINVFVCIPASLIYESFIERKQKKKIWPRTKFERRFKTREDALDDSRKSPAIYAPRTRLAGR